MMMNANIGLKPQDARNEKTPNNKNVLWPQGADDDDACSNVNNDLWPQDVDTSLAQESNILWRGWPCFHGHCSQKTATKVSCLLWCGWPFSL